MLRVLGSWFMVLGLWFMVHGSWFMVHGAWFMVRGSVVGCGFSYSLMLLVLRLLLGFYVTCFISFVVFIPIVF